MRYEFGKNWSDFVQRTLTEQRINIAQDHLLGFLKLKTLHGRTFLDIGCGSGIHSLAAHRAGASKIISFDYDPDSVQTTRKVRELADSPNNWEVLQGSVLDRSFVDKLDRADVVYSWGVLHHTGAMWDAVTNAASTMNPDGVFYVALYTKDVFLDPTPEYWLSIKQKYNRRNALGRRWMEWAYAFKGTVLGELRAGRNPFAYIRNYERSRGMSYWTDVRDWLGGWPMEFAGIAETKAFCKDRLGLELLNIAAGEANTEYLFRKQGARNYWDDEFGKQRRDALQPPFAHKGGYAWVANLEHYADVSDTCDQPRRSRLMLYEDGVPLGFAHAAHAEIQSHGGSRYSHWGNMVLFSTTDNSNPNENGRHYSVCDATL
ncbi:MAG TPA: class I SAM-dependent methyltransferase [Nitrospira sp.]|nr:class I SAM-dependent methyltransferase [Nitrospira sp.]